MTFARFLRSTVLVSMLLVTHTKTLAVGPEVEGQWDPVINYGTQPFTVQSPDANDIVKVTLLRLGAVTHGFDQDARFASLTFRGPPACPSGCGAACALTILCVRPPVSAQHAPPGHYMLFNINDSGVPSEATIVKLQ